MVKHKYIKYHPTIQHSLTLCRGNRNRVVDSWGGALVIAFIISAIIWLTQEYISEKIGLTPLLSIHKMAEIDLADERRLAITGLAKLQRHDILQCSGLGLQAKRINALEVDLHHLRTVIEQCPLVQSAQVVRSLYPPYLRITITERQASALWWHKQTTSLIDTEGHALPRAVEQGDRANLPLIIGKDANLNFADMLLVMQKCGIDRSQVSSMQLIGKRRWNIILNQHYLLKLPQDEGENVCDAIRIWQNLLATNQSHKGHNCFDLRLTHLNPSLVYMSLVK